ncbi:MAG TPA: hypothetical protein VME63_17895 [Dyella sp.]|uniref:hypothetical protein n=1 Tax=Dyella sp. TaxID=1869338 RepID=UPI002C10FC07|nr:hypothetical protein [Dyella sp.]HTV87273.1 hypothetical protein [Dyella sp.]
MSTSSITSVMTGDAIADGMQATPSILDDATSGDIADDTALSKIDDQWLKSQTDMMRSLLSIDKNPASSTAFEAATLQHRNFVSGFSTMAGNLMKSINRLSQING